jgi:hypothetical protein
MQLFTFAIFSLAAQVKGQVEEERDPYEKAFRLDKHTTKWIDDHLADHPSAGKMKRKSVNMGKKMAGQYEKCGVSNEERKNYRKWEDVAQDYGYQKYLPKIGDAQENALEGRATTVHGHLDQVTKHWITYTANYLFECRRLMKFLRKGLRFQRKLFLIHEREFGFNPIKKLKEDKDDDADADEDY